MKRPTRPSDFDWKTYHESLVKRGEFLLDLAFVESWDKELAKMNRDKVGRPFEYPDSLIKFQAILMAYGLTLRIVEGFTRTLWKLSKLPKYNDHSNVGRRTNSLDFEFKPPTEGAFIFADGTGFQAVAGGEYLREKYGKKNRRWVQAVILGDPETKEPIAVKVNIIQGSEVKAVKELLTDKGIIKMKKLSGFGGDGGFDEISLWNEIDSQGMKSAIKPDRNASKHSKSALRNCKVAIINRDGYDRWAESVRYGRRWPATEGIFSAVKRMFGEQLRARSEEGMVSEATLKFWAYQKIKRFGEA